MQVSGVTQYVESQPKKQRAIIQSLRKEVLNAMPGIQEMVTHGALGYSFTGKASDRVVYIMSSKDHITLGFFYGAHLSDPTHLLEGEGKRMRHVKVRTIEDAGGNGVRNLLDQAQHESR